MTVTPYYEDDLVVLYLGDCRQVLPELGHDCAAALVTDPPYGMAFVQSKGTRPGRGDPDWVSRWSGVTIPGDGDTAARDEVLAWWGDRPALVFGTWKTQRPAGVRSVLIWDKVVSTGMGDLSIPWRPSHEEVYVLGQGFTGRRSHGVLRYGLATLAPERKLHPTVKPEGLMRELIGKCPPGAVLDPFAGSGSTLVAARNLGRPAIGVEVSEQFAEAAAGRLQLAAQGALAFD